MRAHSPSNLATAARASASSRLTRALRSLAAWSPALVALAGGEPAERIVAAFDASPRRAGKKIQGVSVLPVEKFPDLARRMHVVIGILTVPAEDAQGVAEMMVASGIQAIWNFAPIALELPDSVIVEDVALYSSLGVLSRRLAVRRKAAAARDSVRAGP